MDQAAIISVEVSATPTNTPLGLEIWINDRVVHDVVPGPDPTTFSIEVNDTVDGEHELKFVLKNKTSDHTKVDNAGNIIEDATITINDLKFDDIKLGHIFYKQAVYRHNFNGNGSDIEDNFFGIMGCNGSVSLEFTTPVYLWLLENM